jgi:2-polyprenyl-3-methyl-5-hydroxy-6-metoxy-1,4-benzoquinol methylase
MKAMITDCRHETARPWLGIPFDVKTNRQTPFGDLLWCPACQKGFCRDMPGAGQIAPHYELPRYYTQGASHMPDVAPGLIDRALMKLAWTFDGASQIGPEQLSTFAQAPGKAVDIGSGNGSLVKMLGAMGFDAVGVEPDPLARRQAAEAGLSVLDGTAANLPRQVLEAKFSLVTFTHVLEHCVHPDAALEGLSNILDENGVIYCEVPNCGSIYFQKYAQISEMLDVPRHLHFFTKACLLSLAERCGLEVLDWHYHGFTRHYHPAWCAWENSIHKRLGAHAAKITSPRRSHAGSLVTLIRSLRARPDRKYDSIGFFARKR